MTPRERVDELDGECHRWFSAGREGFVRVLPGAGDDGMHLSGAVDVCVCGHHTALHVDPERPAAPRLHRGPDGKSGAQPEAQSRSRSTEITCTPPAQHQSGSASHLLHNGSFLIFCAFLMFSKIT